MTLAGTASQFHFENQGTLRIGTIDGIAGVTATGGGVLIVTHSPLTVDQPIRDMSGGSISLVASPSAGDDTITINATPQTFGGSGSIEMNAGDDLPISGAATLSTSGNGSIAATAGGNRSHGRCKLPGPSGA
jgi:hypothetical protein